MGKKKFNFKNECFKVIRGMKLNWKSTEEIERISKHFSINFNTNIPGFKMFNTLQKLAYSYNNRLK